MHCNFYELRRFLAIIALLIAALSLISCKKKEEAPSSRLAASALTKGAATRNEETVPREQKRKIILNHAISLEVQEFKVALEALTKLAEASDGYVFKSTRNSHDRNKNWGEVGIRVPAGKAGSVLGSIRDLGRVENENSTAEDITEGYVDLEARLKNARATEVRLSQLYRQAGKVADVLEVEKELTRVRGDIEAYEAKKKNWDIMTEMVTIEVRLTEASSGFPTFRRLWNPIKTALGTAVESFVDSMAFLLIFLCAAIPWVAVFWPLYVYVKKRRKMQLETTLLATKDTPQNGGNSDNHLP